MSTTPHGASDHTPLTPPNYPKAAPKPIRKRSRASIKTPTTLLNASATNFRALVQQFTGFQPLSSSASAQMQNPKGPVYLSFGVQQGPAASKMADFAENYYPNHPQYHHAQMMSTTTPLQYEQVYRSNESGWPAANNNPEVEEDGWLYSLDEDKSRMLDF